MSGLSSSVSLLCVSNPLRSLFPHLPPPLRTLNNNSSSSSSSSRRRRIEAEALKRSNEGKGRRRNSKSSNVNNKKDSIWQDEERPPSIGARSNARGWSVQGNSRREREKKSKGHTTQPPTSFPSPPARVLVSAAMPVETESILQTKLPVITPSWNTFTKNVVGAWRGVGATFSPITAEMEPIALGDKNEYFYDCRIISTVEVLDSARSIRRRTLWVVGNPQGEQFQMKIKLQSKNTVKDIEEDMLGEAISMEKTASMEVIRNKSNYDTSIEKDTEDLVTEGDPLIDDRITSHQAGHDRITSHQAAQPPGNSSDQAVEISEGSGNVHLSYKEIMEEDTMELEPGLVFFEDGSYSRGPLELLIQESNSAHFSSPTYRIEQCLVIGHTRLRLVHTIAVENVGQEIQILRVAVYEEEWVEEESVSGAGEGHLKLFSQQRRLLPHELAGSWKVFETSATPVLPEKLPSGPLQERPTFVFLSLETLKRRLPPEIPVRFVDEDILDMQNVTILWLPGGITAYVDIKEDGIMTIGAGWCTVDGINHVMERDYNVDGKLFEVRSKSEVKT